MSWLQFKFKKKSILFFCIFAVVLIIFWSLSNEYSAYHNYTYSSNQNIIDKGKTLFTKNCASCHALKEDGMGPPLGGITSLLSKDELVTFTQSPSSVIASGNKRANHLMNRYKVVMPSFAFLKPGDITDIFSYIDYESKQKKISGFKVDLEQAIQENQRFAPPVVFNGLVIELEEYAKIPLAPNRANRKGIATLRTVPQFKNVLFVSDQMGKLYVVKNGETKLFLDLASSFKDFIFEPGIGSGFGSFAMHPDYNENGLFYTTHTETYLKKEAINKISFSDSIGVGLQWVLTEWKMNDIRSAVFNGTRRDILRINTPTTAHGIQDVGFNIYLSKGDPNYGLLYLGIGDGGSNNLKKPELADNKTSPLGSILRIDPLGNNSPNGQYGIPKDNPFYNERDTLVQKEIYAYGFRNPHRFCWNSQSDVMLVADIGEANIEEINSVKKGKHYGWSVLEGMYGIDMKKDAKTVFKVAKEKLANYELPFATFDHSDGKAISGGYVYSGNIEVLKGKYIFGDIVTGRIFYIDLKNNLNNNIIHEIKIYSNGNETTIKKLAGVNSRADLRIGYDEQNSTLFLMTKTDGMLRRISKAYFINNN